MRRLEEPSLIVGEKPVRRTRILEPMGLILVGFVLMLGIVANIATRLDSRIAVVFHDAALVNDQLNSSSGVTLKNQIATIHDRIGGLKDSTRVIAQISSILCVLVPLVLMFFDGLTMHLRTTALTVGIFFFLQSMLMPVF